MSRVSFQSEVVERKISSKTIYITLWPVKIETRMIERKLAVFGTSHVPAFTVNIASG